MLPRKGPAARCLALCPIRSYERFCPEVSVHHHIILTAGRAGKYTCYSSLKNTYIEIKPIIKKASFTKKAK